MKKLVLKRVPKKTLTEEEVENALHVLTNGIELLYDRNTASLSYEELYRLCNLCTARKAEALYDAAHDVIRTKLLEKLQHVLGSTNENLLVKINEVWSEHVDSMKLIKNVLMYLDRSYVFRNKKMTVFNMSLLTFRSVILYHPDLRERIRMLLLAEISSGRNGRFIEGDLMGKILRMLQDCCVDGKNIYNEDFSFT